MMNLMVVVMELMAEERAGHGYELMVMIAGLEWHGWLGDYL
jgi:hypothetical protein